MQLASNMHDISINEPITTAFEYIDEKINQRAKRGYFTCPINLPDYIRTDEQIKMLIDRVKVFGYTVNQGPTRKYLIISWVKPSNKTKPDSV